MNNGYSDNLEILSTRVFDSPRELIFRAWTEPAHLAKWWGPDGFTNTFREFDPKPGGFWDFTMHGPDGTDYENRSVFVEITPPERIVFNHLTKPHFQVIAKFEDLGERTKVFFRMIFEDERTCAAVKVYAVDCNEQNFDRLEAELAKMKSTH